MKDGRIAYLSLRPHFLWQRRLDQEQTDEIIVRAQQPVQLTGAAGGVSIPWVKVPITIAAILVAVALGSRHRKRSHGNRSGKKSWLIDALRRRPNPNIRATKCKVAECCWGSLFVAITPGWVGRLLAWSALLATAVVAALLLEAFAASALVATGTAAPSDVCATPSPVTAVLVDG